MNHRKWLEEDLRDLERLRFSIGQMESELQTAAAEYAAVKATSFDKIPGGAGVNVQEDRLLDALARKDELRASLRATKRRVADLDRLIAALPPDERRVIEVKYCAGERDASARLSEELGFEQAQIYRIRERAMRHLAQMRWGAGFRP